MADNVWFGTYQDDLTSPLTEIYPGQTANGSSGFNGLPFRALKRDLVSVASQDKFQVGMSLEDLVWMYWRVRKWRVFGSITYDPPDPPLPAPPDPPRTLSWDWIANMGDSPGSSEHTEDETDLCLLRSIFSLPDVASGDGVIELLMFADIFAIAPPYDDDALRYPGIQATIYSDAVSARYTSTHKQNDTYVAIPAIDSHVTIRGVNQALVFYIAPGLAGAYFGTFYIEPDEYWPYATSQGNPVYDIATGEQIADPLS